MPKSHQLKKQAITLLSSVLLFCFFCPFVLLHGNDLSTLESGFKKPTNSAKPGVYWYFMDGNMSKEAMTKDLESMRKVGIGNVLFLEVNVGVPRGPVDFLSEQWQELFVHAVRETERLGITMTLGVGPGWTGSGGPWVLPEQSMQHLVAGSVEVSGNGNGQQTIKLPIPAPRQPFFGEGGFPPEMRQKWESFYKDVVVLAFPTPTGTATIADADEKALYYRAPYSSAPNVKPFLPMSASYAEPSANEVIAKDKIVDITDKLQSDGTIVWDVPAGNWTILRFVSRNNGAVTRPAPLPGVGMECDKFDADAFEAHMQHFTEKLFKKIGKFDENSTGGLKWLHMDSWEMGAQNWSNRLREEFIKRRGYDPLPYYPAYLGKVVQSLEMSERFLWDLRMVSQELVLENHAGEVKKYGLRYGLGLSIEPYDMNPCTDLDLGAVADIPMCEFWSKGFGFNTAYSCIESTSIAHVLGKPVVAAEAFTAEPGEGWKQHPASMKDQTDWAFAMGINRLVFHTFQHQVLDDHLRPGMTMGPYGVHWDRNQTWWPMSTGYHDYLARCQFVLQQGRTVSDVLYLTPEGAPYVFRAPQSALAAAYPIPDKKGYNFDACSPLMLKQASVKAGQVVFPNGGSYRLLVLPAVETMTPELLALIKKLANDGATVVGVPPKKSPSLVDYPACDQKVQTLAVELWGNAQLSKTVTTRPFGKGNVVSCDGFVTNADNLYPDYAQTASILEKTGVPEDFSTDAPIRYTHKMCDDCDVYFVANRSDQVVAADCKFRTLTGNASGQPELWDPLTGEQRLLPKYVTGDKQTELALQFEPYQSFFVVFKKDATKNHTPDHTSKNNATINSVPNATTPNATAPNAMVPNANFPTLQTIATLDTPWEVSFDPKWGGPEKVTFEKLDDWTKRPEEGIKYYSGTATYRQTFDYNCANTDNVVSDAGNARVYLDLGKVRNMARVTLNGKDLGVVWTAPWRVDITDVVREKANELQIEVVNLWANRLIGDERLPDDGIQNHQWPKWLSEGKPRTSDRYTFSTYKHYTKDSPLLESGLLGPVTIQKNEVTQQTDDGSPFVTDTSKTPQVAKGDKEEKPVIDFEKYKNADLTKEPWLVESAALPPNHSAFQRQRMVWADSWFLTDAPEIEIEKWVTDPPKDLAGKFVMIEVWATWCPPCRRSLPLLNFYQQKYGDDLVVIAICETDEEALKNMQGPFALKDVKFHLAVDTGRRFANKLGVYGIPHTVILEPQYGAVVWEGMPTQPGHELSDKKIEKILAVRKRLAKAGELPKETPLKISISKPEPTSTQKTSQSW